MATHLILKRADLDRLTPVFGTAQPPRGVSGLLRRIAYRVPENRAGHWALLLFADRVDALEHGDGRRRLLPIALVVGLAVGVSLAARSARTPGRRRKA